MSTLFAESIGMRNRPKRTRHQRRQTSESSSTESTSDTESQPRNTRRRQRLEETTPTHSGEESDTGPILERRPHDDDDDETSYQAPRKGGDDEDGEAGDGGEDGGAGGGGDDGDDGSDDNGGLRDFVNKVLAPLELRKRLIALTTEIKELESILPNLEELLKLKQEITALGLQKAKGHLANGETKNKLEALSMAAEIQYLESRLPQMERLLALRAELEQLGLQYQIDGLKDRGALADLEQEQRQLALSCSVHQLKSLAGDLPELERLQREAAKLALQHEIRHYRQRNRRQRQSSKLERTYLRLAEREAGLHWQDWVDKKVEYLADPVRRDPVTGETEMVMSDRIINLNGPIIYRTADYVCDRIHYYNNKDAGLPIFLVIEYSPGGSVMAGFRIVQAIRTSTAPVYVVVRSFAASMAAAITTYCRHSYIMPNAVLMHHQIANFNGYGNLTQQREALADLTEWWRRIAGPMLPLMKERLLRQGKSTTEVAVMIPDNLEDWIKLLYRNNSDADWQVFGDRAVGLGWAEGVVHSIRQTGTIRHPDWMRRLYEFHPALPGHGHGHHYPQPCQPYQPGSEPRRYKEDMDLGTGALVTYVPPKAGSEEEQMSDFPRLPHLRPTDCYWLYDPRQQYRLE